MVPKPIWAGLAGAILLAVVAPQRNPYLLFVANQFCIYVILAVGLNLLVGYTGQLAFAHAALFGIGAYGTALLKVHFRQPFVVTVPAGALLAMAAGLAISFPALRLTGLYLSLATLAFAQFTLWVFLHWESVTFGAGGFRVPRPDWLVPGISPGTGAVFLALLLAVVMTLAAASLVRSRTGRAMIAVRDGEVAAEALGIDLLRTKATAFGLSAFYAGSAGGLQALMLGYVAPESFDLFHMALMKAMIVVGGMGSIVGSVIGAGAVLFLLEGLRAFKGAQEIAFGLLLMGAVSSSPAASPAGCSASQVGPSATCATRHRPRLRRSRRPRRQSHDAAHRGGGPRPLLRWRRRAGRRDHGGATGRDPRHHRPERRRQDHAAERHLRHRRAH